MKNQDIKEDKLIDFIPVEKNTFEYNPDIKAIKLFVDNENYFSIELGENLFNDTKNLMENKDRELNKFMNVWNLTKFIRYELIHKIFHLKDLYRLDKDPKRKTEIEQLEADFKKENINVHFIYQKPMILIKDPINRKIELGLKVVFKKGEEVIKDVFLPFDNQERFDFWFGESFKKDPDFEKIIDSINSHNDFERF